MKELTKEIIDDFKQPERAITNYIADVAIELAGEETMSDGVHSLSNVCDILEDCIYHLRAGILSD